MCVRNGRICISTLLAILFLGALARAQVLSEREAMRRFYASSPYIAEAQAATAVVESQGRSRLARPNPQAGFEHEGAGLTQTFGVEQSFSLSGRRTYIARAGAAATEADKLQGEFRLWELCSEMRLAFHDFYFAQRREAILAAAGQRLEEVIAVLSEREHLGEGSTFDRLRTEREQANLQSEISVNRAAKARARSLLQSFLGSEVRIEGVRIDSQAAIGNELPSVAELLRIAAAQRGDLLGEARLQDQFQWEQRATSRARIPDPTIFAGLKREEDGGAIRYGPHIGVFATIPLFDRGQYRTAELAAEQRRSASRQRVILERIAAEISGAHEELQIRRASAGEYRGRTEQEGARLVQIATVAYQEGEIGILELLDAYRATRESELRLLELEAAAKAAEIHVERVVGKPVLSPEVLP